MKTSTIIITLGFFLGLNSSLTAQTTATWQGGKPGRPTDWNCPANWSEGRTPDEFSQVIIPAGADFYPVIKNEVAPIDALLMAGSTSLTLQNRAKLRILGETGRFDSLTIFGTIMNNGALEIGNVNPVDVAFMQQIQGVGSVVYPFSNADSLARRQ